MLPTESVSTMSSQMYSTMKKNGIPLLSVMTSVKCMFDSWSAYQAISFESICYSLGLGCPCAIAALVLLPEDVMELSFAISNIAMGYLCSPAYCLKASIFTGNMVLFKSLMREAIPD